MGKNQKVYLPIKLLLILTIFTLTISSCTSWKSEPLTPIPIPSPVQDSSPSSTMPKPERETTPQPTPKPPSITDQVELKYDDATSDGRCSSGYQGYLVHFVPTSFPFTIEEVKIFANLYGIGYEDTKPKLEILDRYFNVLYSSEQTHDSFSIDPDWVAIEVPELTVNDDFYVIFYANSKREGGVYIHYDLSTINAHSAMVENGRITDWVWEKIPKEKTNWMIRVIGTTIDYPVNTTPAIGFTNTSIYAKFFQLNPELAFELDRLPIIEDGISDEEIEALDDIYSLHANAVNPEVEEAFDLIINNGNPYRETNAEIAKGQRIIQSIAVDGKKDDWQDLKPISIDSKGDDTERVEGTDILAIYSAMSDEFLFVVFETDGKPNKEAQYRLLIDTNQDDDRDYAVYFNSNRAWLWDLRDYEENKGEWPAKSEWLTNVNIAFGEVAELKMQLSDIGNPEAITLYTSTAVYPPGVYPREATSTDWVSSELVNNQAIGCNTQLQTLLELALDNEFEKDDTTALAIALVDGFIRMIGDEAVAEKVREDDNEMLNLAREVSSWQEENGFHSLNSLPLEAKIAWAWRGTCGVTGGPGPSWNSQDKIDLETYEWNTVDIETLQRMREYAINMNWISQDAEEIVKNLEDYFHTYGNWLYTCRRPYAPDAPQQNIVIDGVKVSNCGFSNVDFNFQHFWENDFAIGGCRDLAELNNAWYKAIGMSSVVFRRVGAKDETYNAETDPEDLPHYFTIYYEPKEQVWRAYEQQILSGVPPLSKIGSWPAHMYIWLMPVKQVDFFKSWQFNDMGLWDSNFVFIRKTTYEHLWELLSEGITTEEMKQWLIYTDKVRILDSTDEFEECVISLDTPEELSQWMIENIKGESYYEREKESGTRYTPSPDETFEARSGNCRVFAVFACYILQYHGYEAEILSIKVASDESMNHVVCVYRSDGSLYVINNGRIEGPYQNYEDIASAHHEGWSSYEIHYSWDKYQKMGPPDKVIDRKQ